MSRLPVETANTEEAALILEEMNEAVCRLARDEWDSVVPPVEAVMACVAMIAAVTAPQHATSTTRKTRALCRDISRRLFMLIEAAKGRPDANSSGSRWVQ